MPRDSTLQSDEILHSLRLGDAEDDPIMEEQIPTTQQNIQQHPTSGDQYESDDSPNEKKITPAKILHSQSERSGARRLFLFSKQALSENSPDPPDCHLEPMNLQLPTEAPGPTPLNFDPSSSPPLYQALAAYERQFMLYLAQGRVLADGADLRLAATTSCVQEQAVMARALRSAVSNLTDHFNAAARTRAEFTATFQAETARHGSILQRFDYVLNNLANIPLHPSLQSISRQSGRPMNSLLDTVPVERERAWAQQCHSSHQRLVSLFQELDTAFRDLGSTASRQEDARQDSSAEDNIESMWYQVVTVARECSERQSQRLDKLTVDHQEVIRVIMNAINAESDDEVQNAFTPLRELSNESRLIVPSMLTDDNIMKDVMMKVSESKTSAMKRMKVRLRNVSIAQSAIQRCLSSVGVLRDALSQQTENMIHLEHVVELPLSYKNFLSELRRRRAYGLAVITSSSAMMERLAVMRADEVKTREKFLRGPGKHLMPAFFDTFVPTLATPPPIFTPQIPAMVEMDTLPDVEEDLMTGGSSIDAEMQPEREQSGGSASSLTAEISPQQAQNAANDRQKVPELNQQQQDQLIVSADDPADVIMDPAVSSAADAAAKAEVKTLFYENTLLRQELERLGVKPPRTYVDQSRLRENAAKNDNVEIAALRKDLLEAKAQAAASHAAMESLAVQKRQSDKISHSSFEIGDVGLFMPIGRGSRTYVAFHTNCPYRYLSTDCFDGTPDFVLGRIVFQEELVAGEIGTDANPYSLHVGTTFWVLTVEVIIPKKK